MTDTNKNPPYTLKSNQSFTLDLCDADCKLVLNYQSMKKTQSGSLQIIEKLGEREIEKSRINIPFDPIREKLISILMSIDELIDDPGARDHLLRFIPGFKRDGLKKKRHFLIRIDIPAIVDHVFYVDEAETLIRNAINFVQNPSTKKALKQILEEYTNELKTKKRIHQSPIRSLD